MALVGHQLVGMHNTSHTRFNITRRQGPQGICLIVTIQPLNLDLQSTKCAHCNCRDPSVTSPTPPVPHKMSSVSIIQLVLSLFCINSDSYFIAYFDMVSEHHVLYNLWPN